MGDCNCIPRLDDRAFQTLTMFGQSEVSTRDFHIVPPTEGACVTASDIFHEDTVFRGPWFERDIDATVFKDGREQVLELERGWGAQRQKIFDGLARFRNNRADLFGAFYGTFDLVRQYSDIDGNAKAAFFAIFSHVFKSNSDFMEAFGKIQAAETATVYNVLNSVIDRATQLGDCTTVEFAKAIKAATQLFAQNPAADVKTRLTDVKTTFDSIDPAFFDKKQYDFYNMLFVALRRAELAANEQTRGAPPPVPPVRVAATVESCAREKKILGTDGNCQPCAQPTVFKVLKKNPDGSVKTTGCVAKAARPSGTRPRQQPERDWSGDGNPFK